MTETEIKNMALARCGHSTPIEDPDELTNAANLCRTFYDQCRDTVLRSFNWNFAKTRVALALTVNTVSTWDYVYTYPADCLKMRSLILPGLRTPPVDYRPAFEIGNVANTKCILTDLKDAEAIYTARIEDPNRMDPLCISAIAYLLCMEIATPLTGKPDMAANARNGYIWSLAQAAATDLGEGEPGPPPDCEFIAARHSTGFPRRHR